MLLAQQNRLIEPEVVQTDDFETALSAFKSELVAYIAKEDEAQAQEVRKSLDVESDLFAKVCEAFVYIQQNRQREINYDALQMFTNWAVDSNLDAKVADLGLVRQVIQEGDENAFPPIPDIKESNDDLRFRYYLTLLGFSTAGAEYAYKYHGISLGQRPIITVHKESDSVLLVRYEFPKDTPAAQVKDVSVQRPAPGQVLLTFLSHQNNGVPTDELMAIVDEYFSRNDVAPATDHIITQKATLVDYQITATLYTNSGASPKIIRDDALNKLTEYTEQQKRLGLTIEPTYVGHLLHAAGAVKYDLTLPRITCTQNQAPNCTAINLAMALI